MAVTDARPWVTWQKKLPEPVRIQIESAIELLKISGKATNDIEALEAMAAAVVHEELHGLLFDAKHHAATHEKMQRWLALFNAGWRCLVCGTSRDLQCHHMIPRSQGGEDSETNLAVLCENDHRRVTENHWPWRWIQPILERFKLDRLREINTNGWGTRRNRTGEIERAIGSGAIQAEQVGGDTGQLEHSSGSLADGGDEAQAG